MKLAYYDQTKEKCTMKILSTENILKAIDLVTARKKLKTRIILFAGLLVVMNIIMPCMMEESFSLATLGYGVLMAWMIYLPCRVGFNLGATLLSKIILSLVAMMVSMILNSISWILFLIVMFGGTAADLGLGFYQYKKAKEAVRAEGDIEADFVVSDD